ncbi:MAG: tail fiber domain-containing protein [Thermomicrobiales bacterium]
MEPDRFDTWTRRHLGLAGGIAALAGLINSGRVDAKKKKRKCTHDRCRSVTQTCDSNVADSTCCPGLNCDVFGAGPDLRCCLGLNSHCQPAQSKCCRELICELVAGSASGRCCAPEGDLCVIDSDCCTGLDCGQGRCNQLPTSDRTLKTNFGSVDPADMLRRVKDLPITTWNYRGDDPSVRHIGPMAQDFAATFDVGADDRHIHPIDGQGIAFAAIQGLAAEIDALRVENARLAARVAELEVRADGWNET